MTRIRRPITIALVALAGLTLSACGGGSEPASAPTTTSTTQESTNLVEVGDNFFDPDQMTVSAGDTVRWEWAGAAPHNVTGDDFQSETQTEGEFEHAFEESGTFEYACTLHPEMTAVVEVTG